MTIAEFIKEQAKARAEAAAVLKTPLHINGIEINAGCTELGIEVDKGIDLLANTLVSEVKTEDEDCKYDPTQIHRTIYFTLEGTRFYQNCYIKKEDKGNE